MGDVSNENICESFKGSRIIKSQKTKEMSAISRSGLLKSVGQMGRAEQMMQTRERSR